MSGLNKVAVYFKFNVTIILFILKNVTECVTARSFALIFNCMFGVYRRGLGPVVKICTQKTENLDYFFSYSESYKKKKFDET